jgi:hypothetical protein
MLRTGNVANLKRIVFILIFAVNRYRLDLGKKADFWTHSNAILVRHNNDLTTTTQPTDNDSCLTELIKLARNVAAANPEGQTLAL